MKQLKTCLASCKFLLAYFFAHGKSCHLFLFCAYRQRKGPVMRERAASHVKPSQPGPTQQQQFFHHHVHAVFLLTGAANESGRRRELKECIEQTRRFARPAHEKSQGTRINQERGVLSVRTFVQSNGCCDREPAISYVARSGSFAYARAREWRRRFHTGRE